MDRCPANYNDYSFLAWLPGFAASHMFLVSAVKLLWLQLDPEAKGMSGPHPWLTSHMSHAIKH